MTKDNLQEEQKSLLKWSFIFVLISLLTLFVAHYLSLLVDTNTSGIENLNPYLLDPVRTFLLMLQTLGVGLFIFGIFSFFMETQALRRYFSKRLKEIVLEQSYLDKLDKVELKSVQSKVSKAFFKDREIDREGSFFNYFQTNLHDFVYEPYREDVIAEIELIECTENKLTISDKVTYTCREVGGKIQDFARWAYEEGELTLKSLVIKIKLPYNHTDRGKEIILYKDGGNNKTKKENEESVENPYLAIEESLENYIDIDGLKVISEAVYEVDSNKFQYWTMAHPTQNFVFFISYPPEFDIQLKPIVLEKENIQISKRTQSATIKYDSWMLPESGLAWRLLKNETINGN